VSKARVGLYGTKGETLTRSHKFCPKCGAGTFLAEHADRRSCGRCGYMETKVRDASAPPAPPTPKPAKAEAKAPKPKAPKPAPPAAGTPPAAPAAPAAPSK